MIIPQAEKALGRKINIKTLDVSFFSGITIHELAIPATNGKPNFVFIPKMVVKYKTMPLLMKKLMIEAHIPQVYIEDKANNIPEISSAIDLKISVDLGAALNSKPKYDGTLTIATDLRQGKLKPHIKAESQFDQTTLELVADIDIDKTQNVHLDVEASNYLGTKPDIKANITGKDINIDFLLAAFATFKDAGQEDNLTQLTKEEGNNVGEKDSGAKDKTATITPNIHGMIDILNTRYQDLTIEEFLVKYELLNNIFTVKDLTIHTADGSIGGNVVANLNDFDPTYKGRLIVKDIKIEKIRKGLRQENSQLINAGLNTDITFNGKGSQWPDLGQYIDANGTYSIKDGEAKDLPITKALATVLAMPELNRIIFDDMSGTLQMADGDLQLDNTFTCSEFTAHSKGTIGLDGGLDFPIKMTLSLAYSQKLRERASIAKYLEDDNGQTTLQMQLVGSIAEPKIRFDAKAVVSQQIQKAVNKKALSAIEKVIDKNSKDNPQAQELKNVADQLLQGLFGK